MEYKKIIPLMNKAKNQLIALRVKDKPKVLYVEGVSDKIDNVIEDFQKGKIKLHVKSDPDHPEILIIASVARQTKEYYTLFVCLAKGWLVPVPLD
jgi:hypothetical protein